MWVGAKPAQSPFARLSATARRSRLRACGDGSCRVADIAELSLDLLLELGVLAVPSAIPADAEQPLFAEDLRAFQYRW